MTSRYENFSTSTVSATEGEGAQQQGALCAFSNGSLYCPLPSQPADFTNCCDDTCCKEEDGGAAIAWIVVGVIVCLIVLIIVGSAFFNRCSKHCVRNPNSSPRQKIQIYASRNAVRPVDKRLLLQTGNYTVEKNWDQVVIKFHDKNFFADFIRALSNRYSELGGWRVGVEQVVRSAEGSQVCLKEIPHTCMLIVSMDSNVQWVMNDFQNICKKVTIIDSVGERHQRLMPRLPTIGEEFIDAGEFHVKICKSEVEIKFRNVGSFEKFKYVLLAEYPTIAWSKYQQRDCAQVKVAGSGKEVTIHLWEDIQTVWLSGDGKKDWYTNHFEIIWEKAKQGYQKEPTLVTSLPMGPIQQGKHVHIPTVYTVKTLDTGGFEIEFPSADFLPVMKALLQTTYPKLKWKEYSCRSVSSVEVSKSCHISIHISTAVSYLHKMWLYEEHCKPWFNTVFKSLYAQAYTQLYPNHAVDGTTCGKEALVPVEESVSSV